MQTKIKNLLAITAVIILFGCSKTEKDNVVKQDNPIIKYNPEEAGWKQNKSSVNLTWYLDYNCIGDLENSRILTEKIKKDTDINVEFILGTQNKLDAMIASGEKLPDIITVLNNSQYSKETFITNIALSMKELAEKYDPYFYTVADKKTVKWQTFKNGNFYSFPDHDTFRDGYNTADNISINTFLVRKDIYDKLNKPDLFNPEAFLKTLDAVKKSSFKSVSGETVSPIGIMLTDPNKNLSELLLNFLGIPFVENDTINDRIKDPEFVQWMKVFRKANESGLIDSFNFLDKLPAFEKKVANGNFFILMSKNINQIKPALMVLFKDRPEMRYIAVQGPSGKRKPLLLNANNPSSWSVTMISKNCSNPERAMHLITYLLENNKSENKLNKTSEAVKQLLEWTKGKTSDSFSVYGTEPIPSTKLGRSCLRIDNKWNQTLIELITAKTDEDFDKIYDNFLQYRKTNNWEEIQNFKTQKYKENLNKLDSINK